jgi:Spinocerebellar ataxia type 10 protein domain
VIHSTPNLTGAILPSFISIRFPTRTFSDDLKLTDCTMTVPDDDDPSASSGPSWSHLLRKLAKKRDGGDSAEVGASPRSLLLDDDDDDDDIGGIDDEEQRELLNALAQQLRRYTSDVLESPLKNKSCTDESCDDRERSTIRDTRLALRFGLAWVAQSLEGEGNADHGASRSRRLRREWLQQSMLEVATAYLQRILLANGTRSRPSIRAQEGGGGDHKCRRYAGRLLCNLVTDNASAARRLLIETMRLDPGRDALLDRQRGGILRRDDEEEEGNDVGLTEGLCPCPPNWLDMILNNGDNRDVLAAIVATLHNAISAAEPLPSTSSVERRTNDRDAQHDSVSRCFSRQLASHGIVMNSLLRHVVSSQSIVSPNPQKSEEAGRPLDDASDWILVLVRGLVRRGYLRTLYCAVSGNDAGGGTAESSRGCYHALPEHVVLLFCLRQHLENEGQESASLLVTLCNASTDAVDTLVFLADLYADLSLSSTETNCGTDFSSASDSTSRMESVSVQLRALDLLGDLLQDDTTSGDLGFKARAAAGQHPSFLQQLSRDLAALVDVYAQQALPAGDEAGPSPAATTGQGRRVTIPAQDQERLTSCVRLLGNLSYRCRHNQDMLRSIAVPSTNLASSSSATPNAVRNVLHVLMTSTSLAPYCFTLREWAVVAIRNALEDNVENQAVLADLQAQQPASSTALADMGLRVDVDSATGRVNVIPLEDANSAGNT